MKAGLFSVVIPNWNGQHLLQVCLDSLRSQTYPAIEVIVVDNASVDGSPAYIRAHYPEVALIELDRNQGFTGACNVGMTAARGEFIALLNNDTEAAPNWAAEIVAALDERVDVGMAASKMLLFDRRGYIHATGDFFTTDGCAGNRGVWEKDEGQYDRADYVFAACGGSAVYRKTMLERIGLLDDDYFFLLEDIDLAWRAQLAGYKALYVPGAVIYHRLSATGGGRVASFYYGRNGIWLLAKNLPAALWRKYARQIFRKQASLAWQALKAWRGAEARARLRGMAIGLLTIGGALGKRRQIQATKTVTDDYLDSILTRPPSRSS